MKHLSKQEAEGFYAVHRERPFFAALVEFMISGPVMAQVLEGEGAVLRNRELMGATNPKDAAPGTIRADFADSIDTISATGKASANLTIRLMVVACFMCRAGSQTLSLHSP